MRNLDRVGMWVSVIFSLLLVSNCQSQTNKNKGTQTKNVMNMKTNKEIIVDVRSEEEWEMDGHANCSVNYPLDQIQDKIEDLKKYEHIVLVCRSGNRAGVAKQILERAGIKNVENLGPWQNATCSTN